MWYITWCIYLMWYVTWCIYLMWYITWSSHPYWWWVRTCCRHVCVTWLLCVRDVIHSYLWHDSFICVMCCRHVCDMTFPYMWPYIYGYAYMRVDMCDQTTDVWWVTYVCPHLCIGVSCQGHFCMPTRMHWCVMSYVYIRVNTYTYVSIRHVIRIYTCQYGCIRVSINTWPITHLKASCDTHNGVITHIMALYVTHGNASPQISHMWMSHVTHLNESLTRLMHVCYRLIHTCDMTHLHMWHDSFICVTWLIHIVTWTIHEDSFTHQ